MVAHCWRDLPSGHERVEQQPPRGLGVGPAQSPGCDLLDPGRSCPQRVCQRRNGVVALQHRERPERRYMGPCPRAGGQPLEGPDRVLVRVMGEREGYQGVKAGMVGRCVGEKELASAVCRDEPESPDRSAVELAAPPGLQNLRQGVDRRAASDGAEGDCGMKPRGTVALGEHAGQGRDGAGGPGQSKHTKGASPHSCVIAFERKEERLQPAGTQLGQSLIRALGLPLRPGEALGVVREILLAE